MMTTLGSALPLLAVVYGACLGSFLNVVSLRYIDRLSKKPALPTTIRGRSVCPHCARPLRWWELVPLVSFVLLRGRCRRCRRAISYQYPLVEAVTAAVTWRLVGVYGSDLTLALLAIAIAAVLLVLAVVDFKTLLLPDAFILVLTGLVLGWVGYRRMDVMVMLGGIGVGAGFLLVLWLLTRGQGLGLGDIKLMVPLGALFGPVGSIVVLFMAFCLGGIVGVVLLARARATLKTAVPFGPFLIGTALLLLAWPQLPQQLFDLLFP